MKHLLIGAAVAALALFPLHGQGKGNGNGGGHGNAPHGPGPSMNGPSMKGQADKGPSMKGPSMQGSAHGSSGHASGGKSPSMQASAPHGNGHANGQGQAKAERGDGGKAVAKNHAARGNSEMARESRPSPHAAAPGNGNSRAVAAKGAGRDGVEVLQDGRRYYTDRGGREKFDFAAARHGLIDGCPPGLAKKNNGCQPPGLAKQRTYQPSWWGLSNVANAPYVYDNGYLLRLNGDRVASYLPLLGGALSVGNPWPSYYTPLSVPAYYVDYYDLGPAGSYRYADDVLYRVDPSTSAISSIAALLTGDTFNIGSPLPAGYDVYNVPYAYRSQYADGPDAWYRYSDGYVYEVDPTTQLITAAISLLAG